MVTKTPQKTTTNNQRKPAASGSKSRSTASNAKSKSAAARKKSQAQHKGLGVFVMLLGLILVLGLAVLYYKAITSAVGVTPILLTILAALGNLTVAAFIIYGGLLLYSSRQSKLHVWSIVGWLFLAMGILGVLHLPMTIADKNAAFLAAFVPSGGGVFGFIPAILVAWLPIMTGRIILIALAILGLLLGSDFKIFQIFPLLGRGLTKLLIVTDDDEEQTKATKKQEKAAEKAAKIKSAHQMIIDDYTPPEPLQTFNGAPTIFDYQAQSEPLTIAEPAFVQGLMPKVSVQEIEQAIREDKERGRVEKLTAEALYQDMLDHGLPVDYQSTSVMSDEQILEMVADNLNGDSSCEPAAEVLAQTVAGITDAASIDQTTAESVPQQVKRRVPARTIDAKEEAISVFTGQPTMVEAPVQRHTLGAGVNAAGYILPKVDLLSGAGKTTRKRAAIDPRRDPNALKLQKTLADFGVKTHIVDVVAGPAVIRYELQPAPGVKVSKIVNLADDIALTMAAKGLRIEAPVPGKSVVGIEIAQETVTAVHFKTVLESKEFAAGKSKLTLALGEDITGKAIVADLATMPHLLIAGATGSGKSICMNTLICSILFKATPDEVKIIMIDPKKVELAGYNGLPHLGRPVVTNPKKAAVVLKEVVNEMERRYTLFAASGVKNFAQYNEMDELTAAEKIPQIVVLIDELADLMMVAAHDVEDSICRLAQMARAAGIHLVVATQRPSVDVITGLIKANIPSRIAFAVSSQVDSRTILDMSGAEKLLGKGDMLFFPVGMNKPVRVQGAFIKEEDILKLVDYCQGQCEQQFLELPEAEEAQTAESAAPEEDELFHEAVQQVIGSGSASASFLQRRFRIGYNRAARLVETMEELRIVSGMEGNKRQILMTWEQFCELYGTGE